MRLDRYPCSCLRGSFQKRLKIEHQASRKTKIILLIAKKTGLKVVALHAPAKQGQKMIVDSATNSRAKRGVRVRSSTPIQINMRRAEQGVVKRTNLSHPDVTSSTKRKYG